MIRVIKASELQKKDTVRLARSLLGKHLVRWREGGVEARMITEVEAYQGEEDLACHARAGRTRRTEVMYGPGGRWYVYLCYGIHEMLNLVTGPEGLPAAILIRGVEGVEGPGRVTRTLGIDRSLNGLPADESSGLWIEDRGIRVRGSEVQASARVGVGFAGPIWAAKEWRFVLSRDDRTGKRLLAQGRDRSEKAISKKSLRGSLP